VNVTTTRGKVYGIGEFESNSFDGEKPSIVELRSEFLQAAVKLKPSISRSLRDNLLPLYRSIPLFSFEAVSSKELDENSSYLMQRWTQSAWATTCRPTWNDIENAWSIRDSSDEFSFHFPGYYATWDEFGPELSIFDVAPHTDPSIPAFIDQMFSWSRDHHLDMQWCRYHAFETLDLWSLDVSLRNELIWQYLPWDFRTLSVPIDSFMPVINVEDLSFTFDLSEELKWKAMFYPRRGNRKELENAFLCELEAKSKAFEKGFRAYLDILEKMARNDGYTKSTVKRQREHIEWFAKVQILGISYQTIAKEFNSKRGNPNIEEENKSVRKAVNEMSKLISLPIRHAASRQGRRP
jgi:hypothetical protein